MLFHILYTRYTGNVLDRLQHAHSTYTEQPTLVVMQVRVHAGCSHSTMVDDPDPETTSRFAPGPEVPRHHSLVAG